MSLYDYRKSLEIGAGKETDGDPPFAALIMAAMRKADGDNIVILKVAFHDIWAELQARYHAPDGRLPGDPDDRGLTPQQFARLKEGSWR